MIILKTKKIFKASLTIFITITIITLNIINVQAVDYGRISSTTGLKLRAGAGTSYDKVVTVPHNTLVTVNEQNVPTNDSSTGCSTGLWHKITYGEYIGYACSHYVEITGSSTEEETESDNTISDMATMTDEEFDAYLNNQGFPESYKVKLKELHKAHPNWVFVGIKTRANWSTILKNQNISGRNLYQSTSSSTQGYLSTEDGYYDWYTDKFTVLEGTTWYQSSSQTIEYYMDPRNFLNEAGIFMFEDLNYYSSYQTSAAVKSILYTDFYNDLIQYYIEAASTYNVSPIYLAALSRQEVGLTAGYATSGTTSKYCGTDYSGYYNFYNIQANRGVCDGLAYASKESVNWNTKQKAIVEGANWIVSGYINAGQNTPYFQKFNTSINATKPYYHQYMANVKGVASSAITTKNSYSSMNIIDLPIVFQIPIYEEIPESTSLTKTGNPNNWLKTLTLNETSVTNFDSEETSYTVNVLANTKSVNIEATTINSNAKITGTGTITLTDNTTTLNIIVTAQNGNQRTYTLNIIKSQDTSTEEIPKEDDNTKEDNTESEDKENNTSNDKNDNNNDTEDNETNNDNETNADEEINYPTIQETISSAGYYIKDNTYITNITLGSTVQGTITKLQNANKYASINMTTCNNKSKTSGSLVTGDKITIISNKESKTYTVIIYGDINGDGEITVIDLASIQKHLLKKSILSGVYFKAADVDKNGSLTVMDLAKIQKHLLKKSNISQS